MKKLLFIPVIVCFSVLFAQAQQVTWASELVDAIYTNYDNILPLKFEDIDADLLELQVSAGSISKNNKGKYVWTASRAGQKGVLTVKHDGKVLETFNLPIIRFPDPVIETLPFKNAPLSKFKGIKGVLPSVKLPVSVYVQSYDIEVRIGKQTRTLSNEGGALAEEHHKFLRNLGSEAKVMIINIKARCPGDKAARYLGSLELQ